VRARDYPRRPARANPHAAVPFCAPIDNRDWNGGGCRGGGYNPGRLPTVHWPALL